MISPCRSEKRLRELLGEVGALEEQGVAVASEQRALRLRQQQISQQLRQCQAEAEQLSFQRGQESERLAAAPRERHRAVEERRQLLRHKFLGLRGCCGGKGLKKDLKAACWSHAGAA